MLKYIIEEPPEDAPNNRGCKFPFIVSEVFKLESREFMNKFFSPPQPIPESTPSTTASSKSDSKKGKVPDTEVESKISINVLGIARIKTNPSPNNNRLLERLLTFLKVDTELNPTLAGYFNTALQSLYNSRKSDVLACVYGNDEHIENFLKHCYNSSILDITVKLVSIGKDMSKDDYGANKAKVIENIIKVISDAKTDKKVIINDVKFLSALAQASESTDLFTGKAIIEIMYELAIKNEAIGKEALEYLIKMTKMKFEAVLQAFNPSSILQRLCIIDFNNSEEFIGEIRAKKDRLREYHIERNKLFAFIKNAFREM